MKKTTILFFSIFVLINMNSFTQENLSMGINLAGINYWAPAWTFVDRMKNAGEWIPSDVNGGAWDSGQSVPLRSDGYPQQIPYDPGNITPQIVKTLLISNTSHYPAGDYTLIFEGTGAIKLDFDASGTYYAPGVAHNVPVYNPSTAGILLTIIESDPGDPIRNIRFIMPGFADTYEEQIFHPLFLTRLEGMKVIRFMDWGRTNNSDVVEWAERTRPDHYTQALPAGVSYEAMIDLTNALDADPWICIPHLASDDFVRELAGLVRDRMEPGRKIYIEYSNELWNGMFDQNQYVEELGQAYSYDTFQGGLFYNAHRSGQIFEIFEQEFGGTDRMVRVAASQASNSWASEQILAGLNNSSINNTAARADVLAIAPYFGGSIADGLINEGLDSSVTVDQILDRLESAVYQETAPWTLNNSKVAEKYNVRLIAYEGGQHLLGTYGNENNDTLSNKLIAANRDERMKTIYLRMFDIWTANGGSEFCVFNFIEQHSKWGSWGILEYQDQPVSTAPKYSAVQEIIQNGSSITLPVMKPYRLRISN
ncbi:MAG: hypothetical protein JXR86_04610 [Spirochaetales bacterium]|nr:hypothetical protein [Spirochaetales bacterium]